MRLDPSADPRRRADLPDADLRGLGRRTTTSTIAQAIEHRAPPGGWQYTTVFWRVYAAAGTVAKAHAFLAREVTPGIIPLCRADLLHERVGHLVCVPEKNLGSRYLRPPKTCAFCWRELHE